MEQVRNLNWSLKACLRLLHRYRSETPIQGCGNDRRLTFACCLACFHKHLATSLQAIAGRVARQLFDVCLAWRVPPRNARESTLGHAGARSGHHSWGHRKTNEFTTPASLPVPLAPFCHTPRCHSSVCPTTALLDCPFAAAHNESLVPPLPYSPRLPTARNRRLHCEGRGG